MRREKEMHLRLVAEAVDLGVRDARVERRRQHPCLVGSLGGAPVLVALAGTSRDKNGYAVARNYLRRAVWRASGVLSEVGA